MAMRQLIEIDEDRCNGCGQCIMDCAEGALEIANGKAKVVADVLCDGLGACMGGCPQDALKIVVREAPDFDEDAVHARKHQAGAAAAGCKGAQAELFVSMSRMVPSAGTFGEAGEGAVGHWPMKLRLVPADAPYLRGAKITLAADCAAPASPVFQQYVAGRVVIIACPKFEDKQAIKAKLGEILRQSGMAEIDVLRMEVPCCSPLTMLCREAVQEAGSSCVVRERIMGRDGRVLQ